MTASVVEVAVRAVTEPMTVEVTLAAVDVDALDVHALDADVLGVNTSGAVIVAVVLVAVVLMTVVFAVTTQVLVLKGDFLGNHDFASVTSLSLEDDLLVDGGLLENSLAALVAGFLAVTFADHFDDFLTDDAELAARLALDDLALDDLNDPDLAPYDFRFAARLALDDSASGDLDQLDFAADALRFAARLALDDFASGDLDHLDFAADTLLRARSFLEVTLHSDFLDCDALLYGNYAVRFVEW